jgi:hypothetical protein
MGFAMSENDFERAAITALTAAGAGALRKWVGTHRPSAARLVRGAAAGAAAAGLLAVFRLVLGGRTTPDPRTLVDDILSGAGKGVIYTAVLDPLLPGPPAFRGALVGTAEFLGAPYGGVLRRLSKLSPVERIPIVGALLDAGEAEEDPFVAHLLFGVALGLLSGDDEGDD